MELICRTDAVLDPWAAGLEQRGVLVHRVDLKSPADHLRMLRLIGSSDLVHLLVAYPSGKYQLAVALLAAARRRPLIVTHQLAVDIRDTAMPAWRRAFWQACFRLYGRVASWNIASSRVGRDVLVRGYGFSERSTTLIYNGADLALFKPVDGAERRRARRALAESVDCASWPPDVLLSVTIARLSPQKGLADLIDAAARVVTRLPRARFVLVGDGELGEALRRRVADLGLEGRFRFAGGRTLAEIATWLGAMDLFVLSSHDEGMPLALLEAMAAGCPVVATRVGGIGDVLPDDSAGRLVPPADVPALAAAMEAVLDDDHARRAMGAAARRRVMETFDVRNCYEKTTGLYETVA